MTQLHITKRAGLPQDMQTLLRDLPRDGWQDHPHFAASIRNWMGAHGMFRQLNDILRNDTEAFLEKEMQDQAYKGRLLHFGYLLNANLHGHHTWEDRTFFPELQTADPRFEHGLEMLENDHIELDALLDRFTRNANRVVQLAQLEPAQMMEEAKPLRDVSTQIGQFLNRHLTDEEDLVVPILLHHKMRG